jgi:Flp pilus assembly protein TadG
MKCMGKARFLPILSRKEGTVAVETVMLFPVIALVVVAILEFGHLWHVRHTLTIASREGARAAVVYYVAGDRRAWAEQTARDTVNAYLSRFWAAGTWAEPQLTPLSPAGAPLKESEYPDTPEKWAGYLVKVHVETDNTLLLLHKLTSNLTVAAETTMRLE